MIYQDTNFKICLSLFGWKENILPKMHIVHWLVVGGAGSVWSGTNWYLVVWVGITWYCLVLSITGLVQGFYACIY